MSWLGVLLDPAQHVGGARRKAGAPNDKESLAFLLDGRAVELDRLRDRHNLEPLVRLRNAASTHAGRTHGDKSAAKAGSARLLALGVSVVSGDDVGAELVELAHDERLPSDLRVTAWVLARLAAPTPWQDAASEWEGREREWLARWRSVGEAFGTSQDPLVAAIALTHLAVDRYDNGTASAAAAAADRALAVVSAARPTARARLVTALCRENARFLKWAQGILQVDPATEWSRLPAGWLRTEARQLSALRAQLDENFRTAVHGPPYVVGRREGSAGPPNVTLEWDSDTAGLLGDVDSGLRAGLLRYQCVGHLAGMRHARQMLARRRLVEAWADGQEDPTAFWLLVISGDWQAVGDAVAHQQKVGPVVQTKAFVRTVASLHLPDHLAHGRLRVIEKAATLLERDDADRFVGAMLAQPLTSDALDAVAAAASGASIDTQVVLSAVLRNVLQGEASERTQLSLGPAINALSWRDLPDSEIESWTRTIEQLIPALPEHIRVSMIDPVVTSVLAIAEAERDGRLVSILERVWVAQHSQLLIAAALADLDFEPSFGWAPVRDIAMAAVRRRLESARRSSYGFGGLDQAKLLAVLIGKAPDREAERLLVDFLLAEQVAPGDRVGALLFLSTRPELLSSEAQNRMMPRLLSSIAPTMPLMGSSAQLRAAAVRVALGWRLLALDRLATELSEIIRLEPNAAPRNLALIAPAVRASWDDVFFGVLVGMAVDARGPDLGFVGFATAHLQPPAARAEAWTQLLERCLRDQSVSAVRLTCDGLSNALAGARGAQLAPMHSLLGAVEELTNHPSRAVRSRGAAIKARLEQRDEEFEHRDDEEG